MSIVIGDCPFCGATGVPINDEHAYPDWIVRLIQKRRGITTTPKKTVVYRVSHGDTVVREYKTKDPETRVKGPCKTCNEGWMHDLEEAVVPFFKEMLQDRRAFIDHPRATRLALWAVKTAMNHEFIDVGDRTPYNYFTDTDRLAVRRGSFPEREVRLWAVRSSSPRMLAFHPEPLWILRRPRPRFLAYCATMFVELITLQLLVYPMGSDIEGLSTVPGPWERMVQLFPYHSPEPILWPPTTEQLYDEDLYRLPRRFVVGDTTLAASIKLLNGPL